MLVPAVTPAEMAEIDHRAMEEFHIDLMLMMENAGSALAIQTKRLLQGSTEGWRILVMAGKGNNGGGGLASARHLHNEGAQVEVVLSTSQEDLKDAPAKQLSMLPRLAIPVREAVEVRDFELIIDALLGYNQRGDPRGRTAELVEEANNSSRLILALDIPTGLDPLIGHPNQPCIRAAQTLALALPKTGLLQAEAREYVGELFLADIGIPPELYLEFTKGEKSIFTEDLIVRIDV
jgi:NAD(P)H-hydrate epimerase